MKHPLLWTVLDFLLFVALISGYRIWQYASRRYREWRYGVGIPRQFIRRS